MGDINFGGSGTGGDDQPVQASGEVGGPSGEVASPASGETASPAEGIDTSRREQLLPTPVALGTLERTVMTVEAPPDGKAAPPPRSGAAAAGAATNGTQPAGAYSADVLAAALGKEVDPATVWDDLGPEVKKRLAESLVREAAKARIELLRKSAWGAAPEMVLLDQLGEPVKPRLAQKILEVRTEATAADDARRAAEAKLAEERAALAGVLKESFVEVSEQMKTWRSLAGLGKVMLVLATIFAAVGIAATIVFAERGKLGEVETPIIIFALAVFAISPAVLLLRERPLEGLDKWTPSGLVDGEGTGEGEGGGSGSSASSSTGATAAAGG